MFAQHSDISPCFQSGLTIIQAQSRLLVHARKLLHFRPPAACLPVCSGDIYLLRPRDGNRWFAYFGKDDRMRAVIVGAGMGGLMTALALRQSGVFASIDIYEQTRVPSTAGAGLNIPPNGARICRWLGVDLDGGDPKGPDGVIDGGRAAI